MKEYIISFFIDRMWEICCRDKSLVPAEKIETNGEMVLVNTLTYFQKSSPIPLSLETNNVNENISQSLQESVLPMEIILDTSVTKVTPSSSKIPSTPSHLKATPMTSTPLYPPPEILPTESPVTSSTFKKEEILSLTTKKINNASTALSSSSKMLENVIGNIQLVSSYDKLRKRMKASQSKKLVESYEVCLAEVEVKLKLVESEKWEELRKLELAAMEQNNNSISLKPKNLDDKNKYDNCLKILKYCKVLKKEFKF